MSNWNDYFMQIVARYAQEAQLPGAICTAVCGSVGRGEADQQSDLDITIFVEGNQMPYEHDMVYEGELLQIQVLPYVS